MTTANEFFADVYNPRQELMDALINQESGGNNNAISSKGARGLAQIMPATAKNPGYGIEPLKSSHPTEQRRFATDYMGAMLKRYGGNERMALAAYNAGPGAVDAHGDVPPYPETQNYVSKILNAINPIRSAQASEESYKEPTKLPTADEFFSDIKPPVQSQQKPTAEDFFSGQKPLYEAPKTYGQEVAEGLTAAPINAYYGIKQMLPGGLNRIDKMALEQNQKNAEKSPWANLAGNIGMVLPATYIPGANTVAGAGAIGAMQGLMQPTQNGESHLPNALLGGIMGSTSQKVLGVIGNKITSRLAAKEAEATMLNNLSAQTADSLQGGQALGMKIAPSAVNPSWINRQLESAAGKSAVRQEVQKMNQQATNIALPQDIGLSSGTPINTALLNNVRAQNAAPYQELAGLQRPISEINGYEVSPNIRPTSPAQDLEAWKQARSDIQDLEDTIKRQGGNPALRSQVREQKAIVSNMEARLSNAANVGGRPELMPALQEAKKNIAKTYTIENALNRGSGDINLADIGKLIDEGVPLEGNMKKLGMFQQAFSPYVREGSTIPTPGVSKVQHLAMLGLGMGGEAQGAGGFLAGGIPLISEPIRKLILSDAYQKIMAKVPQQSASQALKNMTRLVNSQGIKGLTPALSAKIAISLLNNGTINNNTGE